MLSVSPAVVIPRRLLVVTFPQPALVPPALNPVPLVVPSSLTLRKEENLTIIHWVWENDPDKLGGTTGLTIQAFRRRPRPNKHKTRGRRLSKLSKMGFFKLRPATVLWRKWRRRLPKEMKQLFKLRSAGSIKRRQRMWSPFDESEGDS